MLAGRAGILLILTSILMAVILGLVLPPAALTHLVRMTGAMGLTGVLLCVISLGLESYYSWQEARDGEDDQGQDGDG